MEKVRWTEKASSNLEAIFKYIEHDSNYYAERFIKALIKSTFIRFIYTNFSKGVYFSKNVFFTVPKLIVNFVLSPVPSMRIIFPAPYLG